MTVTEYLLKHAAAKTAEVSETLRVIKDDCCGYASAEHLEAKTALGDARELLADAARIMAQVQKLLTPNDKAWPRAASARRIYSALLGAGRRTEMKTCYQIWAERQQAMDAAFAKYRAEIEIAKKEEFRPGTKVEWRNGNHMIKGEVVGYPMYVYDAVTVRTLSSGGERTIEAHRLSKSA